MERVRRVLVLNCGSSTLKWAVLDATDESTVSEGSERWPEAGSEPLLAVLDRVGEVDAVGHRIVHGGALFRDTVLVDAGVRAQLESLVELDPLHMRRALAAVDAVGARSPSLAQFAAFDTAFHATLSEAAAGYGLPFEWSERWGLRRFGFHGLSVAHATERAREMIGHTPPRLVVCHLGSGCSVTAMKEARSVDTTMGFTPLEGIMMATRSGSVDPGLLLFLQSRHNLAPAQLQEALAERSGLLGVSGVSGDLREVLAAASAGSARAALAYERFILFAKRAIGSMTAVLGGLDALVFTGGIGENNPRVRRDLVSALGFAGARLDAMANDVALPDVDVAGHDSAVRILRRSRSRGPRGTPRSPPLPSELAPSPLRHTSRRSKEPRHEEDKGVNTLFAIGDHLAGASVGALTALGVRALVSPGLDMVVAMLLGMAIGMAVHVVVGLLLSPLLGMFETMTAAMLIGMYGGMLFGMRDSMQAGSASLASAVAVGALFGVIVVFALKVYDRVLRGAVVDTGD